ncbi:hypothetical protein IWW34DRAFT_635215 [Fusarium oxysporum f. sp. albedinis]|nr:hypothetical protein IWW34DRAFT_635215 [Fusarium oxysporum f. sp. albedinis]
MRDLVTKGPHCSEFLLCAIFACASKFSSRRKVRDDPEIPRGLHDREAFLSTIAEYNRAVYAHRKENPQMVWNPTVRDGLSTQSATIQLALVTSNWALPIDQGPFLAVKVTCGITFTFGGLSVDSETAQVISSVTGKGVPGVYCYLTVELEEPLRSSPPCRDALIHGQRP